MRISNITAALLLGAALLFHPLTSAAQTEAAAADTLQDQGLTQEDITMHSYGQARARKRRRG